jgi:hypothetical protein
MAPSTKMPMEVAIPASDIRLALSPIKYMGMKVSTTLIGMVRMGTMAEPFILIEQASAQLSQ